MQAQKKPEELRVTVLGNFMFLLLNKLPVVKGYSAHQSQYLQLVARFASLGAEARLLLLNVGSIERLMNMFHGKTSPYYETWLTKRDLPVFETENPDMGLPTPAETEAQRSAFAMMKEK
jgi:hypothetical protein